LGFRRPSGRIPPDGETTPFLGTSKNIKKRLLAFFVLIKNGMGSDETLPMPEV